MSIDLRTHLAAVYTYSATGTSGRTTTTLTRAPSPDDHKLWWCSRGAPTGRERIVGRQPDTLIDTVIGFSAEVPVNEHSIVLLEGQQFEVHVVLPRDHGTDEVQCLCENVTGQQYQLADA